MLCGALRFRSPLISSSTVALWSVGFGVTPTASAPSHACDSRPSSGPDEATARTFVGELTQGQWAHPKTRFTSKMTEAMPAEKMRAVWQKLEEVSGSYREIRSAKVEVKPPFTIVHLTCGFERTQKFFRVTLNETRGRWDLLRPLGGAP